MNSSDPSTADTATWTSRWVKVESEASGPPLERILAGLGLASLYGIALGARSGGFDLMRHGLGAPAGLALAAIVTVPSLFVVLAILNVPLRASQVFDSATRGVACTGLVLAGLTPAVALFSLTVESLPAVRTLIWCGFALAGVLGLLHTTRSLKQQLGGTGFVLTGRFLTSAGAFCVLVALLASRAWSELLPILGGAS